ncbi:hypothetical protein [Pseudomonas alkylphenolica]|uniref:hypothetical protein n=1 Tax=Pseudomonas alkylphenolica TaxID=237609 RepID=UPI0013E3AC75|nr:hypothetical protein [Pseudomonas alkylphenolica]
MQAKPHHSTCKVYLHPVTCSRPGSVDAFQRRTGLHIIVSPNGHAQAVQGGGAA